MKKVLAIMVFVFMLSGCKMVRQSMSHIQSATVGIRRTVVIYDNSGNAIRRWVGKINVEPETGRLMLQNGEVVYTSGTYIIEEEK